MLFAAHVTVRECLSWECVVQVYSSSRAFVPSALHSSVRVVENKVSELGSPLLTAVATRSEQVLTSLDRKVRLLLSMRCALLHACAASPVSSCSLIVQAV